MWPCTPEDLNLDLSLPLLCSCCELGGKLSLITNPEDVNWGPMESQGKSLLPCPQGPRLTNMRACSNYVCMDRRCGREKPPRADGEKLVSLLGASSPSPGLSLGHFYNPQNWAPNRIPLTTRSQQPCSLEQTGILRLRPAEGALGLLRESTLGYGPVTLDGPSP